MFKMDKEGLWLCMKVISSASPRPALTLLVDAAMGVIVAPFATLATWR